MRTESLVVGLVLLLAAAGPAAATAQVGTASATATTQAGTVPAWTDSATTTPHAGTAPAWTDSTAAESAGLQQSCAFPVTETDATDAEVTVEAEPERITVLGPSAAQTLWEIGARDRVIAAPHQYAEYLDGVEETTDVSGSGQSYVSTERVVNTSPDLVLAPNVITDDTVSKLREAGLTVFKFREATTIGDVYAKTELTGQLVGECEGAAETVAWMQERIGAIEDAVADEERPRVLISLGGGFSAGNGTFVAEIVTTAGTENVAASAGASGYVELSSEEVVEQDPEWIVENGPFATYPRTDAYNATTAVQSGQVFAADSNHASQPAPRIVYAIENVTAQIHPEAHDEAMAALAAETTTAEPTTADGTATEETTASAATTAEPTATAVPTTGTAETTETTESGGQPGFGVGIALLTLLAIGLLAAGQRRT